MAGQDYVVSTRRRQVVRPPADVRLAPLVARASRTNSSVAMSLDLHSPSALLESEPRSQPLARPHVSGVSLATPARAFTQDEMLDLLGLRGNEFAEGIFERCG